MSKLYTGNGNPPPKKPPYEEEPMRLPTEPVTDEGTEDSQDSDKKK